MANTTTTATILDLPAETGRVELDGDWNTGADLFAAVAAGKTGLFYVRGRYVEIRGYGARTLAIDVEGRALFCSVFDLDPAESLVPWLYRRLEVASN